MLQEEVISALYYRIRKRRQRYAVYKERIGFVCFGDLAPLPQKIYTRHSPQRAPWNRRKVFAFRLHRLQSFLLRILP